MGGVSLRGDKLFYEKRARDLGYTMIAGVDEAGRGPLAGPVVAVCCSLGKNLRIEGIDDSKKLTPKKREEIYQILSSHSDVHYSVGVVDAREIDRINIYQATINAMLAAIDGMSKNPDYVIVDGMNLPHPNIVTEKVIKGDTLSLSVGAASIMAKVIRDGIMRKFHEKWPCYNFIRHKGYPTEEHIRMLKEHGPCEIHRASFEPVKTLKKELNLCSGA